MEPGAHVWVTDDEDGDDAWILAEVVSRTPDKLNLFRVDDTKDTFTRQRFKTSSANGDEDEPMELKYEGVELANAMLSDGEKEEGKDDDMITLPHLHEPAILHAIGERFKAGRIYTWTGPVLIAVNPFQRLPLYTTEVLESYRREGLLRSQGMGVSGNSALGPHVYAVADLSYRQMMSAKRKSQAILISGESGAGKTESTKIVMLYLTTLGTAHIGDNQSKSNNKSPATSSIMERVLQSNPILEAFGNARTLRNDNSSRFGKFIELGFSRTGSLLGAKVQTYLLEKVRLGFHASGERNFHIFYQLLRGASDEEKKKYGFHDGNTHGLELANHYHYTGQGGAPQLREFTDEEGLKGTLKAMKSLGWDDAKTTKVLSLVAGLLHLGQLTFNTVEQVGQEIAEIADRKVLENCAELLGVGLDKLKSAVTERIIITRGDAITIQLEANKAVDARDALARTIYGALFLWVVDEVNQNVCWEKDSEVRCSTGVLDIFGFECFAVNSFEQLCINFTNEALQQQFNKFIFKLEQAEYERESIEWAFISFPDNQDCLDTIQSKPHGVLTMLDDECRLGARGNDRNWADRLNKQYIPEKKQVISENTRYSATAAQKANCVFCIRHFAGNVEYTATTGFLEKNKDEISVTAKNLFDSSESWLVKDIYAIQIKEKEERAPESTAGKSTGPGTRSKKEKSKTVGQQFKEQLAQLMQKIESVEPHYIRCLKPNDAAKPRLLTRRRLTEQLRYGGVLEAVRVARMGYPVRLDHKLFFQQYRLILPTIPDDKLSWSLEGKDAQALCIRLLDIVLDGGSKDESATARATKTVDEKGITRSDRIRRRLLQPAPINFPKTDVQLGQSKVFMRKAAHDTLEGHRVFQQTASATMLQAWIRGLQKRMRHLVLCDAILTAQRFYRGCKGRERWWGLREGVAGDLFTKVFRMLIHLRRYNRARKGIILFQGVYQGHAFRRILASTKIQTCARMCTRYYMYRRLKSATVAVQCRHRCGIAKVVLKSLMGEQKDIGKLKENNEKLKLEMASLKAMLSAQAKGDANRLESNKELQMKENQIEALEQRIAVLEEELERERTIVKQMETDFKSQKERSEEDTKRILDLGIENKGLQAQFMNITNSPKQIISKQPLLSSIPQETEPVNSLAKIVIQTVADPTALTEHKVLIAKLEEELNAERHIRREADSEVIKLRAKINGVEMSDADVAALLPDTLNLVLLPPLTSEPKSKVDDTGRHHTVSSEEDLSYGEDEDGESVSVSSDDMVGEDLQIKKESESLPESSKQPKEEFDTTAQSKSDAKNPKNRNSERRKSSFMKSPGDFLPMIRRGILGDAYEKETKDVVSVGWKVEVTNRKEREESLRDEVHRFEVQMSKFYPTFEQGVEVMMWQMNRISDYDEKNEFTLKAAPVQVKLHRCGELFVQAVIEFTMRGGYLSKALNRRRVDKSTLDPLALHEILEVKAGCHGYDYTKLPAASKGKIMENRHNSLFLTLKASPTPLASSRLYYLKFKSRSGRNDLMMGLRGLLADLQIHEGVSISSIHTPTSSSSAHQGRNIAGVKQKKIENIIPLVSQNGDTKIELSKVHKAIDKEREAYDKLILILLQGNSDLKEKEDDMLELKGKLNDVISESREKDRIQTSDSQLIMQLSKKLEILLMENEGLRENNDHLNNRLVNMECDKMNSKHT